MQYFKKLCLLALLSTGAAQAQQVLYSCASYGGRCYNDSQCIGVMNWCTARYGLARCAWQTKRWTDGSSSCYVFFY